MSYRLDDRPIGFGTDPATNDVHTGIEGNFFIPSYQRGYRWTPDEVFKLLDDLMESARERKTRYSLQPIVVKKRPNGDWELIDGQQRLTTLWLIFNYLHKAGYKRFGAAYTLEYETRPGSHAYLQSLDAEQATRNIDYFHLHQAHQAIGEWIDRQGSTEQAKEARVNQLHVYLSDSVRIIWYEVPENEEPIPLFTRLNQGRIPLTDAELLKAVLLTHVEQQEPGRQIEVAAQWDGIERDLQRAEIWAFLAPQGSHSQDQHATRIDLLLDTLANKPAIGARRYYTFDALNDDARKNSQDFWKKVVALHAQILGWFEEPRWHNKIGFLVACGLSVGDVLQLAQEQTKTAFEAALDARIKSTLDTRADDLHDTLSYDKTGHKVTLQRLLLLFNVLTCRERFPFKEHLGKSWSLEHIHAQNAQDLTRAEQWETWLQEHRRALGDIKTDANAPAIDALLDRIHAVLPHVHTRQFDQEQFRDLAGQTLLALNDGVEEEADHSIANLALLSNGANAALSNAVFEVKRQRILAMDKEGEYIPAATRNVFLKYYAQANHLQPHFWSETDKDSYLQTLKSTLAPYLQ
ncbi:DUF262 domain-containing protein [Diaphorobacter caeni]|uniref:DUF262 domain-containing protein n=1 Tax=Diaphorobacter caeni TaxID=2784387 RepID=UPI00188FCE56|nr:DUF262 domain-containing protein [Diaphorobacter caeni]MBF5007278.1 DUF262 domain-containing protein [Diaphorobacter caeni]